MLKLVLMRFKKVLKPRRKRVVKAVDGMYYAQYKSLLGWRNYHISKNRVAKFDNERGVEQFLKARHFQEELAFKNFNEQYTQAWEPKDQ